MFRAKPAPNPGRSYEEIRKAQERKRQSRRERHMRELQAGSKLPRRMELAFAREASANAARAALRAARSAAKICAKKKRGKMSRMIESEIPNFKRLHARWDRQLKAKRAEHSNTRSMEFSFQREDGRHTKAHRMREQRKQKEKDTQEMRIRKEIERREKMRNRARRKANKAAIKADKQRKLASLNLQREMERLDEERERALFGTK